MRGSKGYRWFRGTAAAAFAAIWIAAWLPHANAQLLPTYRPNQKYRSLNTDQYEIAIRKNGRLDVVLVTGDRVFENVFPMVWFAGEDEPERLPIAGRSSGREAVDDPLGQGQGMLLRRDETDWSLRTYPAKPYFAVQTAYTNTGDEPVQIKALMPFCVGEPKDGTVLLGPGSDRAVLLSNGPDFSPVLGGRAAESPTFLGAVNRATGRSLIMGFVTENRGRTRVELSEPGEGDDGGFGRFRAVCTYDPPITVQPGERLESEVFYVAVAESNPLLGLERYARAAAVVQKGEPGAPFLPLGWYFDGSWTDAGVLETVDGFPNAVARSDWRHVVVSLGAMVPALWDPEARGDVIARVRGIERALAKRGYTLGVALPLFEAPADAAVVRDRPTWFHSEEGGTAVVNPETAGHELTVMLSALVDETGVRGVYDTSGEVYLDRPQTDAREAMREVRLALQSAQNAVPPDVFFASPVQQLFACAQLDGVWIGPGEGARWDTNPFMGERSVSRELADGAGHFFLSPHWWRRVRVLPPPTDFRPGPVIWNTWLRGSAMLGDGLLVDVSGGGALPEGFAANLPRLRPPERSAVPLDIFDRRQPAVWAQGANTTGELTAALFNWDGGASSVVTFPFEAAGMSPSVHYRVYEPLEQTYHGSASGFFSVSIRGGGCRVFQLSRRQDGAAVVDDNARPSALYPYEAPAEVTFDPEAGVIRGTLPDEGGAPAFVAVTPPEGWQFDTSVPAPKGLRWTAGESLITVRGGPNRPFAVPLTPTAE